MVVNLLNVAVDASSLGNNTIITAVANKRIYIHRVILALASPTLVTFKSGTSTTLSGPMTITSLLLDLDGSAYFKTAVGESLVIALGDAYQMGGVIGYTLQDS